MWGSDDPTSRRPDVPIFQITGSPDLKAFPIVIFLWPERDIYVMKLCMVKVDIDRLSEEELIELNQKVVARLRFLREMRSHVQMLDYRIGERVGFRPPGQPEVHGTLTRYNKKSVTVISDSGQQWRVHPGLLFKVNAARAEQANNGKGPIVVFPNNSGR